MTTKERALIGIGCEDTVRKILGTPGQAARRLMDDTQKSQQKYGGLFEVSERTRALLKSLEPGVKLTDHYERIIRTILMSK